MTVTPDTRRATRAVDKISGWNGDEIVFVVSSLILHIADVNNVTIRELTEDLIGGIEQSWAAVGGDVDLPPRKGSGGPYQESTTGPDRLSPEDDGQAQRRSR